MSSFVLASPLQAAVPDTSAVLVLFVLLSGGLIGMSIRNMFESIMSEEEEDGGGATGSDAEIGGGDGEGLGGGLMDEGDGSDDDLGGLGGLDDDDLGGLGDDEFGDMGSEGSGAGGNVDELEHRLSELENEVGSLSSTVNTVRNENEQISESVGEVEENVRKLLDIYEMVTRGVNPFADDIDAGMGGGMGDGSFGLFADEDVDEDDVDEDVAEADAEGFFDEDLIGEEDEMSMDADPDDVLGGGGLDDSSGDAFQDSFDEGFGEDEFDTSGSDTQAELGDSSEEFSDSSDDSSGGSSFEDLKEEYESGEADWADDDADVGQEFEDDEFDDEGIDEFDESVGMDDEFADDELFDEVIDEGEPAAEPVEEELGTTEPESEQATETAEPETEAATKPAQEPTSELTQKTDATATDEAGSAGEADSETGSSDTEETASTGDGKPYLSALPEGFAAELIVVEWLEFLVDEAGIRGTAEAIDYYESIDWIDDTVADDLQSYLRGFDGAGEGSLTIDHHTQSLEYIGQLNGNGVAAAHGLQGGGASGLQR